MKVMHTIAEAMTATGLGRTTLYAEMTAGRLAFVHVGARRLIPAAALEEYVELLEGEAGRQRAGVAALLDLADEDGRIDVERLPSDATIGDLRAAQELLARSSGSGSAA